MAVTFTQYSFGNIKLVHLGQLVCQHAQSAEERFTRATSDTEQRPSTARPDELSEVDQQKTRQAFSRFDVHEKA